MLLFTSISVNSLTIHLKIVNFVLALTLLNGQFFVKVTDIHSRKKYLFQELLFIKTIMMFTQYLVKINTAIHQLTGNQYTNLQEIMGWESSDVFRFDLGAQFQGEMTIVKFKSSYNFL